MSTKSTPIKKGSIVIFNGYEELEDGQKPIFEKGEKLEIVSVDADDESSLQAVSVDDENKKDGVFSNEVTLVENETAGKKPSRRGKAEAPATPEEPAPTATKPRIKKGKAPEPAAAPAPEGKGKKDGKKGAKPKKAKPVPKEEEIEILPAEAYTESVQKITKSDASALKAAKSICEKLGENFLTLGGVLSFIYRHRSYKTIKTEDGSTPYDGKKGFAMYAENELGLDYRRAMYYIDVHETFGGSVDEERLLDIGWSKLKNLVGVVNDKNVEAWLKKSEELSRDELQAEIKTAKEKAKAKGSKNVNPSEEPQEYTKFKFVVRADQGKNIMEALSMAEAATGTDDVNANVVHIVNEWITLQGGDAKVDIDDAFKTLENRYSLAEVSKYVKSHYGKK